MKNSIKLLLIIAVLFVACTNTKTEKAEESEKIESLEGMWTLKSGNWLNDDGTYLVYPGDSIMDGLKAYIVYSKSHFNLVANAPKINLFRSEHAKYTIVEGIIRSKIILSNIEGSNGKESEWDLEIVGNTATFKDGVKALEVWQKVE